MTTTTTSSGALRAECDHSDRKTRPRRTDSTGRPLGGRLSIFDLPRGWSVAPYPADYLHTTGRRGDAHYCPPCERRETVSVRYEPGFPDAYQAPAPVGGAA